MISSINTMESGLAVCLLVIAIACLFDRHLLRACWLLILFALLMSVAWWYLNAPWLALVEVVLGGVLTGGSFLYALRNLPSQRSPIVRYDHTQVGWSHRITRVLLTVAWSLMLGVAIQFLLPDMALSLTEHPLILAAVVIVSVGMGAFALHRHLLRRLMAFNVLGSGVFLMLAGMADTRPSSQALISVGLVIAWLGSLLGVLLIRRLVEQEGSVALDGEQSSTRLPS
ncbi:DUF4040 domain-containing protein [Halomonas sp. LY9]